MTSKRLEPEAPPRDRAKWFLLVSIGLTIALFHVPYGRQIGFPLVLISTVAHELGHALTAILVGGSVDKVEIFLGGGGVAHTAHSGRVAAALVSAGGLVGPAIAAALCFAFARSPRLARGTMLFLGGLLALAVVFWIRNLFGLVYVPLLAATLLAIGWRARPATAQLALVFVAVQLALSVYSRSDYLFTKEADFGTWQAPSDVANMSKALFLPYWFWGGLCAAFSAIVLVGGLWLFLRPRAAGAATAAQRSPRKVP